MDSGNTLENIFFIELMKLRHLSCMYWRTKDKVEIDCVIDEQYAFEVKVNKNAFNIKKYKSFMKKYPQIPVNLVCYKDEEILDILDFSS